MTTVTVLYPGDADFKMDYYLAKHMPLVDEKWKKHGLKGWKVIQLNSAADGSKPQYGVQATLMFSNTDEVKTAFGDGEQVLGDIPNFSDKQPVIMIGEDMKAHGAAA